MEDAEILTRGQIRNLGNSPGRRNSEKKGKLEGEKLETDGPQWLKRF